MIRINHITKSYDATKVLDDVSLEINRNEVVSIIGYSGSGKSTLLGCIAGLLPYESGTININNKQKGAHNGIGLVFQSGNLFPHLTILQNLTIAPEKVLGMSREEAETEASDILDEVGLWSKKNSYPDSLSYGQRQRVAIARCLMMKPDILLLDEPTSSLDPVSAIEVLNVLNDLKKKDITIVLVTHSIDLARSISDRIVFMHNGKICEQGTPEEIINSPKNNQTRAFINYCINMVFDIQSSKYDQPGLNAKIEDFCMRYRLPASDARAAQLVAEELLNILPLEEGLRLIITKTEKGLCVKALLHDVNRHYLSEENIKDDLSYSIIKGMCKEIEEVVNEAGRKVIRLTIKD